MRLRFGITLLFSMAALGGLFNRATGQTTATDFTLSDCTGTNYHLFGELDGGKVVVAVFVMPCVGCISPATDVQNIVESYASSHPGKVEMFLIDDDGLTTCTELMSWRNANGIHLMPTFSDPAVVQDQYGTPGMPKIVVLGGTDHKVWGNQNNTVDIGSLYNSIDAALGLTTSVADTRTQHANVNLYPNPASGSTSVSFSTEQGGNAMIRLLDIHGRTLRSVSLKAVAGANEMKLDLSGIAEGYYSVLVTCGNQTSESKIRVK
ncbi:MAG: T9SS type A sorting domain-containing protein [Taibaiella sp.]|nr:T9SS type A sorting domain-containing protein [Taibaiella sp.]